MIEWQNKKSEQIAGQWSNVTKEEHFPITLESNVLFPATAGLIVLLPSALIVAGIAIASGADTRTLAILVMVLPATFCVTVSSIALLYSLGHYKRLDLYERESSREARKAHSTLRLEVVNSKSGAMYFRDLPVEVGSFISFAKSVTGGRDLSLGTWTGSAGQFSRSEYNSLLDYLMVAGLVRWCNPSSHSQGREVTPAGRATLARFVESQRALEG